MTIEVSYFDSDKGSERTVRIESKTLEESDVRKALKKAKHRHVGTIRTVKTGGAVSLPPRVNETAPSPTTQQIELTLL